MPAQLVDGINEKHLQDIETKWVPFRQAVADERHGGNPPLLTPGFQSWRWNWRKKQTKHGKLLDYPSYAIEADGETQGVMFLKLNATCLIESQKDNAQVYVLYLETAPWNLSDLTEEPRFRGVGSLMMAATVQASRDEGYKGRVGLASLPQAVGFYKDKIGMTAVGPDLFDKRLTYFEMTPEQADAFLPEETEGGDDDEAEAK